MRCVIYRKKGKEYFKRIFNGNINVKWFGAKGEGITDDTDAIQKAINTANSKTLSFPPGVYNISKTLIIPDNKQINFLVKADFQEEEMILELEMESLKINWTGTDSIYTTAIQGSSTVT